MPSVPSSLSGDTVSGAEEPLGGLTPDGTPAQPVAAGAGMSIATLFHFTAFAVLIGWLLVVGRSVILPLVISAMITYVLLGAAKALRKIRPFSALPVLVSYFTVLVLIGLSLTAIVLVAVANLRQIALTVPQSQDQILTTIGSIAAAFGFEDAPTWDTLRTMTIDRLDLTVLSLNLLSSVAAIIGNGVLVMTYVAFMFAERGPLKHRIAMVIPDESERGMTRGVFDRINAQIVRYLSAKTLMNVLLGGISYVLMLIIGVDNAVFWAFMIALFNYIPYVGSLAGVMMVVIYVLLTSASLGFTILTGIVLTVAQVFVGNVVEPKVMSRSLNLSPLVVLVALVVWSSLWGLTGAIIAVPMTSIVLIVLAAFRGTRFIAVLLSGDGRA